MPGISENYIQITINDKVVFVASVLSTDSTSLEVLKRKAAENFQDLIQTYEVTIARLEKRLDKVESDIKAIKGEE